MTALGVDYAWQHPNPSSISSAGYQFALRYLSTDPSKDLSAGEVTGLQAAGVSVGLVWETTAQRALQGGQAGTQDGQQAATMARQLGYPVGAVIFANIGDFAATPDQIPVIDQYYQGFAAQVLAVRFEPGGYGTGWIVDQLVARGTQGYWWQNAINDQGSSGSTVSSNAHIYQRVAPTRQIQGAQPGSYDENVLLKPVPLWGKAIIPNPNPDPGPIIQPPPQPAPTVPTPIEGENMQQLIAQIPVGDNGEGFALYDGGTNSEPGAASASPAIPYGKFIAATPYGPDLAAGDADWGPIAIDQQERNGFLFLHARNAPKAPPGTAATRVVATVTYAD